MNKQNHPLGEWMLIAAFAGKSARLTALAGDGIGGRPAEGGDADEIAGGDVFLPAEPAAAYCVDERRGSVFCDILAADAASRDEFDLTERARQRFHSAQTAKNIGREELDDAQTELHGPHDLAGGGAARAVAA